MKEILRPYQDKTATALKDVLKDDSIEGLCEDLYEDAVDLIQQGKMVRGSLVLFAHDMYSGEHPEAARTIAAAIEIIHTSLLVHDDIIDRDERRRGRPALHERFSTLTDTQSDHTGKSLAICSGDTGFFQAFELLSSMEAPAETRSRIVRLFAREFADVGHAESRDILMGVGETEPDEDDIIDLYRGKTARYTFSLPLMAGAILADAPESDVAHLEGIGEELGIIYQLKDDALDLFQDESVTGKDRGSDLREDKKTLHRQLLLEQASEEDEQRVRELLGTDLSGEEIETIIDLMDDHGIKEQVTDRMECRHDRALEKMEDLSVDERWKEWIRTIASFCRSRSH